MRYIEPPNQILRYALIQGLKIDSFAEHVGSFIAVSLFHTSALALDGGTKRQSWFNIVWCVVIWCVVIWYDMIWCNMTWYDMIWHDMIWYDIMWYDMIWYNMI